MSSMSSIDEGSEELKTAVTAALRESGALASIRAQLRAAIFSALSDRVDLSDPPFANHSLTSALARHPTEMALVLSLVADVLATLRCHSSANVFAAEALEGLKWDRINREDLKAHLHDDDLKVPESEPVLLTLLQRLRPSGDESTGSFVTHGTPNTSGPSDRTFTLPSRDPKASPNDLDSSTPSSRPASRVTELRTTAKSPVTPVASQRSEEEHSPTASSTTGSQSSVGNHPREADDPTMTTPASAVDPSATSTPTPALNLSTDRIPPARQSTLSPFPPLTPLGGGGVLGKAPPLSTPSPAAAPPPPDEPSPTSPRDEGDGESIPEEISEEIQSTEDDEKSEDNQLSLELDLTESKTISAASDLSLDYVESI